MKSKTIISTITLALALSISGVSAFAAGPVTTKHIIMPHTSAHIVASSTKKLMHEENASSTKKVMKKKSVKKVIHPKMTHKSMTGHMPVATGTPVMLN